MVRPRLRAVLLVGLGVAVSSAACRRDGCVGGDDGRCLPAAACQDLRYDCAGARAFVKLTQLAADADAGVPSDPKTLAAPGDFVLENDRVRVVLDAPEHRHHLAPSGGSIIDFSPIAGSAQSPAGDQTNAIYQAAGLLPRDAAHYDRAEAYDNAEAGYVAVVFRGRLEGDRRVSVVTRYELRPCEPGVRVRTDLYNGAPDPNTLYLTDAFFWGDHTLLPFVPGVGLGFRAPDLDLEHVDEAWREWPFMAARTQAQPETSYASVPCDKSRGAGFNSTTLTAAGVPLRTTASGDGARFERFLIATQGPGLAPAVSEALRVRAQVHGEPAPVVVSGRIVDGTGVPFNSDAGRAASLLFYEPAFGVNPDDEGRRTPWTEAVPDNLPATLGRFQVSLPPERTYRIQAYAFGRPTGSPTTFQAGRTDIDLGDLQVVAPAKLVVDVQSKDGPASFAQLVVVPAGPPGATPAPTFYGLFPGCEPMLGPPHGRSPACNRALVQNGHAELLLPGGSHEQPIPYFIYATRGPFATLDRVLVALEAGGEVHQMLTSKTLENLVPAGWMTGDFHVHGAGSYDSSIPDQDRVVSFLAAGLDLVVATDHDVVTTYTSTLAALGAQMVVIPGVEQTPNILWFAVPGETFPKTLGHFNFWPLAPGMMSSRIAAPWDELSEPGQLMDDIEPFFSPAGTGIRQLNHPYAETKLGRDQGFLRAINYDPRRAIDDNDTFASRVLNRRPGGDDTHHRNLDWDVQEVMTGASRADWLRYRALWFSMLSQGHVKTGTANSDTHSLALEQAGYPRNLVLWKPAENEPFDVAKFNAEVRAGHVVGTNGPVLDVWIDERDDDSGNKDDAILPNVHPSQAIRLTSAMRLHIAVSGASWIRVQEVRVIVNGEVKRSLTTGLGSLLNTIPIGDQPPWRVSFPAIPVAELGPTGGDDRDFWIVVEAGMPFGPDDFDDIDDDGLPDWPTSTVTPDSISDLQVIAPGVWPEAFTNPFLIDRGSVGWTAPGL